MINVPWLSFKIWTQHNTTYKSNLITTQHVFNILLVALISILKRCSKFLFLRKFKNKCKMKVIRTMQNQSDAHQTKINQMLDQSWSNAIIRSELFFVLKFAWTTLRFIEIKCIQILMWTEELRLLHQTEFDSILLLLFIIIKVTWKFIYIHNKSWNYLSNFTIQILPPHDFDIQIN